MLRWLLSLLTAPTVGARQAPLNETEIAQVQRLLSDPSVFPKEFKQWITDHSSDTVDIAKGQVHGLINSSGQLIFSNASWDQLGAVLTGVILPWPATVPPTNNWLSCDGNFYLQTAYPKLFDFIGHAHDPFVNTGSFAVPDLRGRAIYGYDPSGGPGSPNYMPFAAHDPSSVGGRGPFHHHVVTTQDMVNVGVQLAAGSTYPRFSPQNGDYATTGAPPLNGGAWYALNYIIATGNMPA